MHDALLDIGYLRGKSGPFRGGAQGIPFRGVPKNLKKGGRNFLYSFSLKISVKTKKKVFTSFDVQFIPQNRVKTKKKIFTVLLTADIRYISAYISAGRGATPVPPGYALPLVLGPKFLECRA